MNPGNGAGLAPGTALDPFVPASGASLPGSWRDSEDDSHSSLKISYAAPLARPFMGATVGEEQEVTIGGRTILFRVVGIE